MRTLRLFLNEYTEDEVEVTEEDDFDNYDAIRKQLSRISDSLGVSGKINQGNKNEYIYSISSRVKLYVRFNTTIRDMYVKLNPARNDGREVLINCYSDTTEISNMSDELNTATMVAREISNKLI